MQCRLSDLRDKELINISDGSRYGYVGDVELDLDGGRITSLIVPGPARFFGLFGRGEDYVFPFDCVRRFGEDIILVESEVTKFPRRDRERHRRL